MTAEPQNQTIGTETRSSLNILYAKLLDALRHREQEIFRYLAIVAPAIGGLLGLSIYGHLLSDAWLVAAMLGLQLLAVLGGWYALALSYNYRYVLAQIRLLEDALGIEPFIAPPWSRPRGPTAWCWPPEIMKVFWFAFVALAVVIALAACLAKPGALVIVTSVVACWLFVSLQALILPAYYGAKLSKYHREPSRPER